MDLRATINGVQYDVLQGATFAKEYNETLDSGSIIMSGVEKIKNLTPYDDVYIYSFTDKTYKFKGYPFDETNPKPKFYKHLLVDQFTEDVLRLGDSEDEGRYKYKLELVSETKKLETIQCPNKSFTQPLKGKKRTILELIQEYLELYGTLYKKAINLVEWEYAPKYTIGKDVEQMFASAICPEFSMAAPNLRTLLSKLFLFKDCIPYIEDDVLHCMDISKRHGKFDANPKYVNRISGSRTSDNHCDNLRRNYSDALTQEGVCRSIEYLGFRNSDNTLMTIENMRLETNIPIYKPNKMYLCYYKQVHVNYTQCTDETLRAKGSRDEAILCRQDITKLLLLNTERNARSLNWDSFNKEVGVGEAKFKSIDDLAKYKFTTLGYDIGSKVISGWGEMFTYPQKEYDCQYTFIQNIAAKLDFMYPWGVDSEKYFENLFGEGSYVRNLVDRDNLAVALRQGSSFISKDTTELEQTSTFQFFNHVVTPFTNPSLSLKGLFFFIDYCGFYNGAILHSKNNERDDITINDNASEPLTIIEQDAILQNEKIKRFGNKTVQIRARYDRFYDDNGNELIQPLGSVYESSYEDDVVIYHVEYSVYDNYVQCIYYGVKNYVLKNYYTSVFARYRTWSLMPYNESVERAENKKFYLFWSTDASYYEGVDPLSQFRESPSDNVLEKGLEALTSFIKTRDNDNSTGFLSFNIPTQLNTAYLSTYLYEEDGTPYKEQRNSVEMYVFTANNSLCFNMKTFDNYSAGTYISNFEPFIGARDLEGKVIDTAAWMKKTWDFFYSSVVSNNKLQLSKNDYSGSEQTYSVIVDSQETGETKRMGFYVGHIDSNTQIPAAIGEKDYKARIGKVYEESIFAAPKVPQNDKGQFIYPVKSRIGVDLNIYKDNKESIDMTMQIENVSLSKDVFLTPWIWKLSDLDGRKPKFDKTFQDKNIPLFNAKIYITGYVRDWGFYKGEKDKLSGKYNYKYGKYSAVPIITVALPKKIVNLVETEIQKNDKSATFFHPNSSNDREMTEFSCNETLRFNYSADEDGGLANYRIIANEVLGNMVVLNTFVCNKMRFTTRNGCKPYNYTDNPKPGNIDSVEVCELVGKMSMWYIKAAHKNGTTQIPSKMVRLEYDNYVLICPRYGTTESISGSLLPNTIGILNQDGYGKFEDEKSEEFMWFSSMYDVDKTFSTGTTKQYTRSELATTYDSSQNLIELYKYPYAITTLAGGYLDLDNHDKHGNLIYPIYRAGQMSAGSNDYCLGSLYALPYALFESAKDGDIITNEKVKIVSGGTKICRQDENNVWTNNSLPERFFAIDVTDIPSSQNKEKNHLSSFIFANLDGYIGETNFDQALKSWATPYKREKIDQYELYPKKDVIRCLNNKHIYSVKLKDYALTNKDSFVEYQKNIGVAYLYRTIDQTFIDNSTDINSAGWKHNNVSDIIKFDETGLPKIQIIIPDYGFYVQNKQNEEVYCSNFDAKTSDTGKYFDRSDILDADKLPETVAQGSIIIAKDNVIYIVRGQQDNKIFVQDNNNKYSVSKSDIKAVALAYKDDSEAYSATYDEDGFFKSYTYNPENCLTHWVLGANIPERTKYFNIYLSLTKFKDMRVFDEHHQIIGKSLNYSDRSELFGLAKLYSVSNFAIIRKVSFNNLSIEQDGEPFESKEVELEITDNKRTYIEGNTVVPGTTLSVKLKLKNSDKYWFAVKKLSINGKDYRKNIGNISFVVQENQLIDIDIECAAVVKASLSDLSWKAIKNIVHYSDEWADNWQEGERKAIELEVKGSNETVYIRLVDKQAGRYETADGLRRTRAVFDFETGLGLSSFNSDKIEDGGEKEHTAGGWALSQIKKKCETIYSKLPQELRNIIEEVVLTEYSVTGESPRRSTSKLFLPAETEMFDSAKYSAEGIANGCVKYNQFDFYKTHSPKKWNYLTKEELRTDDTTCTYWLRSPQYESDENVSTVWGKLSREGAYTPGTPQALDAVSSTVCFICPCFAI